MMTLRKVLVTLAASALILSAPTARAAYPEKPITLIVAFGAGGGTDLLARALAPALEKQLGNGAKVEVINKPGAGGEIGFAALADAAPDGYTIGFINGPNVVSIPIERSNARYSLDRLDPLANLVDDPGSLAVHADSPYKTLQELVNQAKTNPNTVTVGTTGVGSDDHLAMLMLQREAQTQFVHVPFPGSGPLQQALAGKKIIVGSLNIGEAMQYKQKEPIRILGQMSEKRWDQASDVPTFKEQGYKVIMASLRGIGAPKGLPAEVRTQLADALLKAANDPEFQAKAKETFQPLRILDSAAYATELKKMDDDLRALWKENPWLK